MKRHQAGAAVVLSAVVSLTGCDGKSAVQPTSSAGPPLVGLFSLSGRVVDPTYRPVADSRVEVVDGPRAGTVEVTNEAGQFILPGTFTSPITVRASKDGYLSETRVYPPPGHPVERLVEGGKWEAQFYLSPAGPLPDLAGTYSMTITADNACMDFPAEARTRRYTATVIPLGRPGFFLGSLSDARFAPMTPCPPGPPGRSCLHNGVSIGTAGDYTNVGFSIIEQLSDHTYLVASGGAGGFFGPTGITAPLAGYLQYCQTEPTLIDQGTWTCPSDGYDPCESVDHRLTLVRR